MPTLELSEVLAWGLPVLVILVGTFAVQWLLGKTFSHQPNNRLYRQFSQRASSLCHAGGYDAPADRLRS